MSSVTVSVTNQHRTHALRYFIETSGSGNTRYSLRVQYSEWTVGLLSSATCGPIFVQFTGCHQPVQRSYIDQKNAIDMRNTTWRAHKPHFGDPTVH